MRNKNQLIGMVVIALVLVSMVSALAQDWPQWRGPNRDGKVARFTAPATWPQALTKKWSVTVGAGPSTPALVNNRLYVFTRQEANEILQCLDAGTGKQIWQASYPAVAVTGPGSRHPGPRSSPTVAEGKVVTLGVGNVVSCFDVATGKLLWRNEEYTGAVPAFFTGMSLLVSDGMCIGHLGGSQSGSFVAFDLATGTTKWKTEGDAVVYGSPSLMTVEGTKQAVFQTATKLVGVGVADGKLLWEIATPVGAGRTNNSASPVVDQQKVYYTGLNNGISAIEIKKEGTNFIVTPLWKNPDLSTSYNTPVLKDGFLYGVSNTNFIFCINASNGQTAWIDTKSHQNFASVIDAGSVLFMLSSTSNLVVFKPSGQAYSEITTIKVADTTVYAHPVISGNRIFVKDDGGTLVLWTIE